MIQIIDYEATELGNVFKCNLCERRGKEMCIYPSGSADEVLNVQSCHIL